MVRLRRGNGEEEQRELNKCGGVNGLGGGLGGFGGPEMITKGVKKILGYVSTNSFGY